MQRRDFLGKMTAAAASFAAPTFVSSDVLGRNGRLGANDRVNVGIIGLGGRARDIAKTCLHVPQMRVVAVCDCFRPRCGQFITAVGKDQKWSDYVDFREMIDKENLDAVMVETTTHARAWATIIAMQAGMDVYIEKPMCLTIEEGRYMVEAARKYGRVTQVGTQQRSMPINNWASDLVKNGAIGTVHTVLAPNFVGPDNWTGAAAQPLPRGGKEGWWDIWTRESGPDINHVGNDGVPFKVRGAFASCVKRVLVIVCQLLARIPGINACELRNKGTNRNTIRHFVTHRRRISGEALRIPRLRIL